MSLPARQQRVITEIDSALRASAPHLASMYAMFARLNQQEPVTAEPLAGTRRRQRVPGDAMFAVVLLPVMSMMIILGVLVGGTRSTGSCDVGYAAGGISAASRAACPAVSKPTASTTSGGTSASCPASASAAGQAESAAQSATAARLLTGTAGEQALSPSPATSDTSGVC
jgi:hypothetical protein